MLFRKNSENHLLFHTFLSETHKNHCKMTKCSQISEILTSLCLILSLICTCRCRWCLKFFPCGCRAVQTVSVTEEGFIQRAALLCLLGRLSWGLTFSPFSDYDKTMNVLKMESKISCGSNQMRIVIKAFMEM